MWQIQGKLSYFRSKQINKTVAFYLSIMGVSLLLGIFLFFIFFNNVPFLYTHANYIGKPKYTVTNSFSCGTPSFTTVTALGLNGAMLPLSIAVADINKDGKLDLATANRESSNISLLLGNGDGTFQSSINIGLNGGVFPQSITIGDINRDEKLDLITANLSGSNLSVLLGNGDGTFQPADTIDINDGSNPISVTVEDINNDGKLDLATANADSNNISVLLGNGDGTFQTASNPGLNGGARPVSISIKDINGDNKQDIVTSNENSTNVSILLGIGDGTFQPTSNFNLIGGGGSVSVAINDLNGDSKQDIVVSNRGANNVSVLLGNGDGTFQSNINFNLNGGVSPVSVVVDDSNRDGKLDLLTVNPGSNDVSVLLGNGDGTFQPTLSFSLNASTAATKLVQGDFNNDGLLDLSTTNLVTNKVLILLNKCNNPSLERAIVFVADTNNNRIQRTSDDGATWQSVGFGLGTQLGQFRSPKSVSSNSSGQVIFVADTLNNRVQRSTNGGNSWHLIASSGVAVGQVNQPQGVAYDEINDKLYISDTFNNRIQVVTNAKTNNPITNIYANALPGISVGRFNQPTGIAIDLQGRVYVCDTLNNRIQVNATGLATGWTIFAGATAGKSVGKMNAPRGIFVDSIGKVYVADTLNNRIQVNTTGQNTGWSIFMMPGINLGAVNAPQGVTVALSGSVFVADTGNNRIQKKLLSGNVVIVGIPGFALGQFNQPTNIR